MVLDGGLSVGYEWRRAGISHLARKSEVLSNPPFFISKALASPQETFHYDQRLEFDDRVYWSQAMQRAIPSLNGERYEVLVISVNVTEKQAVDWC